MNLSLFLQARIQSIRNWRGKRQVLRDASKPVPDICRADWEQSLKDPSAFYLWCFHYFHQRLPEELRTHREYFRRARRGFGEEAFHTMWFLLFREFQPATFLEIGVYRGQTLSLCALLGRMNQKPCDVFGISPFSSAGDAVSRYRSGIDYESDTLKNFTHFDLPRPNLLKAYSTDPAAAALITSKRWDAIYIDGNHDYPIAKSDWEICARNLSPGGLIVLDDAGLTTAFKPPVFATAGHPDPSRVAQEIDAQHFTEILQVGHNRVFQRLS